MDRNTAIDNAKIDELNVALRKESVDRNSILNFQKGQASVALRKESVDRNADDAHPEHAATSRSPQGERG